MNDLSIPIYLDERDGIRRSDEAVRIGVPIPRGLVRDLSGITITDSAGHDVPHQFSPLAFWGDRSVKWLLVDALALVAPHQRSTLLLRPRTPTPHQDGPAIAPLSVTGDAGEIAVDTGRARFVLRHGGAGFLESVSLGHLDVLAPTGTQIRLTDADGHVRPALVERLDVEDRGPVRGTVRLDGRFLESGGQIPLRFSARLTFLAGSSLVSVEFRLWNPQAASHPGGLWDLGDRGSYVFKDLTLALRSRESAQSLRWYEASPNEEHAGPAERWSLYQDSSGGERWDSINHVGRDGRPTVAFRGYRVSGPAAVISEGLRATPRLTAMAAQTWMAVGSKDFWQNFPKALRWQDNAIEVSLFPGEARALHELQGGEQKRHTAWLDFGVAAEPSRIAEAQHPVCVSVDPASIESSRAVLWFSAEPHDATRDYQAYVSHIVDGPHAFITKRERIDEFGWRNFGDLYADHEAVRHRGPEPFVSHYNNQYDFVYGAFVQFQRTGDPRWRQLLDDAARHVVDIDVYHTQQDKASFNGGMFWHTDHYLPAATCSHRTYSRANRGSGDYGGGPSNEHNYTSGLLHYYYLTGDPDTATTLLELAEWVFGMDDGARTLFGIIDGGSTGGASKTLEASYHHPGRGCGNSINALLDAYSLSRNRRYLAKAEELLQRCIHPDDDISSLGLDDPEHRWSYLVFLQILGKYLALKIEIGELDYGFHYARESLLHFADWVAAHEVPYKDVLHKVELPTETWPAHDVRKAQVLHIAASHSSGARQALFDERATFFFQRCLSDLLTFETSYLTRPLVILCTYGSSEPFFQRHAGASFEVPVHNHAFGAPSAFVAQRERLRTELSSKFRIALAEASRLVKDAVASRVGRR